jgi:hypothetical protein
MNFDKWVSADVYSNFMNSMCNIISIVGKASYFIALYIAKMPSDTKTSHAFL